MPHFLAKVLLILIIAATLAGCSSGPTDASTPRPEWVDGPAVEASEAVDAPQAGQAGTTAKPPRSVEVYNLSVAATGVAVFDDAFEAPAGTTELTLDVHSSLDCIGAARLVIQDPDGDEVAAGNWECDPTGGACVVCLPGKIKAKPGTYQIAFHLVGDFHLDAHVMATIAPEGHVQ